MAQNLNFLMQTEIKITDPTSLNAEVGVLGTVFDDPNVIKIEEDFDYAYYDSRSAMIMAPVPGVGILDAELTITAIGNFTVNLVGGGTAGSELVSINGSTITLHIEDTVSTQQQIATALKTLEEIISVVALNPVNVWTLGVGTDTVILAGAVIGYREFIPPFENVKFLILEVGTNKKANITVTDSEGDKEIKDVERLFIMYGLITKVKIEAQEDNTYIKLVMVGNNL